MVFTTNERAMTNRSDSHGNHIVVRARMVRIMVRVARGIRKKFANKAQGLKTPK